MGEDVGNGKYQQSQLWENRISKSEDGANKSVERDEGSSSALCTRCHNTTGLDSLLSKWGEPSDCAFATPFPNLCDACVHTAGCSERQRRGSFGHQRGQEPGVRPADGLVPVATYHLSSAQHLQPHGDVLRLVPPEGQPLHPLPGFLPLR